ncbi:estradiol 17-beta-dehydrogenase 8-like [Diadema antillarum]|uniref:estradiol 17-beta-dehydrogenase 8-like n=1 Tax=Diadema antillarum TaxID=105358 RepID=UPI003A8B65B6
MATGQVLAGRVAIVTGGGSGIGRAVCQLFAKNGASVVAADLTQAATEDTVASLDKTLKGHGQAHRAFAADVRCRDAVQSLVAEVTATYEKPPTVLVNSAGITKDQLLLKMTEENFDDVINVNLKGTFLMSQAVSQAMVKSKVSEGSIINISSIVAKVGNMGQTNYSASKAGVIGMTKTMAKELSRFNIRCNAILPGFIETPMTDKIPEKVLQMMVQMIPLGFMGRPEDIAETCLFLASSQSSYITGASIEVTGGLGM